MDASGLFGWRRFSFGVAIFFGLALRLSTLKLLLEIVHALLELGIVEHFRCLLHLPLRILHPLLELRTVEHRRGLCHLPLRIFHPLLELGTVEHLRWPLTSAAERPPSVA